MIVEPSPSVTTRVLPLGSEAPAVRSSLLFPEMETSKGDEHAIRSWSQCFSAST